MNPNFRCKWILEALTPALLLLLAAAAAAQEEPPTEPDEFSAAIGRQAFRTYCTSCHGDGGLGDGSVAEFLRIKPADLTQIKKNNGGYYPFQMVVEIIDGRVEVKGHGQGEMPVWGNAFKKTGGGKSEEEVAIRIEQLAHYLWTIQEE